MFVGHYRPEPGCQGASPRNPALGAVRRRSARGRGVGGAGASGHREGPDRSRDNRLESVRSLLHALHAQPGRGDSLVGGCRCARQVAAWNQDLVGRLDGWNRCLLALGPGSPRPSADLPLYDDTRKIGLGFWNYPALALSLEAALLFGGMILYLRATRPINALGRLGPPAFGIVMLAIQAYVFFGPPPASSAGFAVTALVFCAVFALVAQALGRQRRSAAAS